MRIGDDVDSLGHATTAAVSSSTAVTNNGPSEGALRLLNKAEVLLKKNFKEMFCAQGQNIDDVIAKKCGGENFTKAKCWLLANLWFEEARSGRHGNMSFIPSFMKPRDSKYEGGLDCFLNDVMHRTLLGINIKLHTDTLLQRSLTDGISQIRETPDFFSLAYEALSAADGSELSCFISDMPFSALTVSARNAVINGVDFSDANAADGESYRNAGLFEGATINAWSTAKEIITWGNPVSDLRRFDFSGHNLSGATLNGMFFSKFIGANLDNSDLTNFRIGDNADLSSASLVGAKFGSNYRLIGKATHSCDLTKTFVDFRYGIRNSAVADITLNHLNNQSGTLLTGIRDWPQDPNRSFTTASRNYLMHELAAAINDQQRSSTDFCALQEHSIAIAVADVVFKDPSFSIDPHPQMSALRRNITVALLNQENAWETQAFSPDGILDHKNAIETCVRTAVELMGVMQRSFPAAGTELRPDQLRSLTSRSSSGSPAWLLDSGINHIFAAGLRHTGFSFPLDDGSIGEYRSAQAALMQLRACQFQRMDQGLAQRLDDEGIKCQEMDTYIEHSADRKACIAYDQSYYQSMINITRLKSPEVGFDWKSAYRFDKESDGTWSALKGVGQDRSGLDPIGEDLKQFSITACYQRAAADALRHIAQKLFDTATEGRPEAAEFEALFKRLRQQPSQTDNDEKALWLSVKRSSELADVLAPCLKAKDADTSPSPMVPGTMRLADEHVSLLNSIMDTLCANNTHDRACWFLALAAVYTKLSSSALMGVEGDSPLPVRSYATALLYHAHDLDADLFVGKEGADNFEDWRNSLCGEKGAFTCTAVLTDKIKSHIQGDKKLDVEAQRALIALYPPNWM